MIAQLKEVDEMLDKEKDLLGLIRIKIWVCNSFMTLLIALIVAYDLLKFDWISDHAKADDISKVLFSSLMLFNTLILAFSVVKIRQMLNSLHNAFPNEYLIGIHVINSAIYTLLFFGGLIL